MNMNMNMNSHEILRFLWCILVLHTTESFPIHGLPQFTTGCCSSLSGLAMIGSGFSFDDGEQILVSVQKPLGMVLEQENNGGPICVSSVDPSGSAARAGVKPGDVLLAIQNADATEMDLEEGLQWIGSSPAVLNLRFLRS